MPDDLTSVQRYVLLTLMIKARAMPLTAFPSLKLNKRRELVANGLIETTEKPITLDLTRKGHDVAEREFTAEPPARSGSAGVALYAALDFLRQLTEHTGAEPRDLFRLRLDVRTPVSSDLVSSDLETRIRKAYTQLAPQAGDYVMLADLRTELHGVPKTEVDAALIRLNRSSDVHLVPESNQKVLTEEQRSAAVSIGNQHKHLLAIGA
jgi:hypothetical protein